MKDHPATRRLFWLGMHKVLKRTELAQLRAMGFEVFNPPYLSQIYDQSADRRPDTDQPTTLPADVFAQLMRTDFFYRELDEPTAELLNEWFDAVIVTINADWLGAVLRAFRGPIVYRVYGQPYSLSEHLVSRGLWSALVDGSARIVPFAAESIEDEQRWFQELCTDPVPYQLSDEVFDWTGRWTESLHDRRLATAIPNIENAYYAEAYARFARDYPHASFRILGPQRSVPDDPRIVGSLERQDYLGALARSAGFLYPYTDAVCYLPPVEMMELHGPVLYAPGSLLDRFMATAHGGRAPGRIDDPLHADESMARLIAGDRTFASELVAAQEPVRRRYDRALVRPIFERVLGKLLAIEPEPLLDTRPPTVRASTAATGPEHWLAVMLHVDGLYGYSGGRALGFEGIPRVVESIVRLAREDERLGFLVSTTANSRPILADLFLDLIRAGRVELRSVELGGDPDDLRSQMERLWLVEDWNGRMDLVGVLVPHYYLFPEALLSTVPLLVYLPDYFPHLMPGTVFDVSAEKDAENKRVGVAIAQTAGAILTNSRYTRAYLTEAGFIAPGEEDKVVVAYLPLLGTPGDDRPTHAERLQIEDRLAGRPFLFYPTANRPNKQIAFLLRVFAAVRVHHPGLALVLTCDLNSVAGVGDTADALDLRDHLVLLSRVSDGALTWLYRNAAAVPLTSTLEGNFPPQVREALANQVPLVATRLPMITEVLGHESRHLLLCQPLALDDFVQGLMKAIDDRATVLAAQERANAVLLERCSIPSFRAALQQAVHLLSQAGEHA